MTLFVYGDDMSSVLCKEREDIGEDVVSVRAYSPDGTHVAVMACNAFSS